MLFVLTGACLTLGGLALAKLFDDYKDSPDSYYIESAAFPLALAVLFLAGAVLALRGRHG